MRFYLLRPRNTGNIFVQLVAQQCFVASWDCLLHVLPPSRATNFHVAESRCHFYFLLQHKNLLRAEVVIRAANNLNLQRNIVARQVARKCCPYYWAFTNGFSEEAKHPFYTFFLASRCNSSVQLSVALFLNSKMYVLLLDHWSITKAELQR